MSNKIYTPKVCTTSIYLPSIKAVFPDISTVLNVLMSTTIVMLIDKEFVTFCLVLWLLILVFAYFRSRERLQIIDETISTYTDIFGWQLAKRSFVVADNMQLATVTEVEKSRSIFGTVMFAALTDKNLYIIDNYKIPYEINKEQWQDMDLLELAAHFESLGYQHVRGSAKQLESALYFDVYSDKTMLPKSEITYSDLVVNLDKRVGHLIYISLAMAIIAIVIMFVDDYTTLAPREFFIGFVIMLVSLWLLGMYYLAKKKAKNLFASITTTMLFAGVSLVFAMVGMWFTISVFLTTMPKFAQYEQMTFIKTDKSWQAIDDSKVFTLCASDTNSQTFGKQKTVTIIKAFSVVRTKKDSLCN